MESRKGQFRLQRTQYTDSLNPDQNKFILLTGIIMNVKRNVDLGLQFRRRINLSDGGRTEKVAGAMFACA